MAQFLAQVLAYELAQLTDELNVYSHRQDVGEDGHDGRVQVGGELLGLEVSDVHDPEGVGAGVGQPLVGDQEEGDGSSGGQKQDQGDDDLLGHGGAPVVAVLALLAGLKNNRGCFLQLRNETLACSRWTVDAVPV